MKFVTYVTDSASARDEGRAGVLYHDQVLDLARLGTWAARHGTSLPPINGAEGLPVTVLELLRLGPDGMAGVRAALATAEQARPEDLREEQGMASALDSIRLRTPPYPTRRASATATPSSSTSKRHAHDEAWA